MRRVKGFWALVTIVGIAVVVFTYTFAVGNKPLLGLDLQGGVSVVLAPKETVDTDSLDQAKRIIDNRVNALGVAEPEITRQGNNILVQIAGVKDKDRALELIGKTAELQFRPVLAVLPPPSPIDQTTGTTTVPGQTNDTAIPSDSVDPNAAPPTTAEPATSSTQQQGLGLLGNLQEGENAAGTQTPSTVTDSGAPTAPPSTIVVDPNAPGAAVGPGGASAAAPQTTTLPADVCETGIPEDKNPPDQSVQLPQCNLKTKELEAVYQLGPTALGGTTLETARANLDQSGKWIVSPVFKDGADGIDQFNAIAAQCNQKAATCPTGQLAIVLDANVISAPAIQEPTFKRDQIQISGSFTQGTAKDLATALKYGALPVAFEVQTAQLVSATLGRDALHAGLIAGAVGFVLVAIYMIAFYRLLGVFAVIKLGVEGMLLWSIIAYLGTSSGLALTLAGITGIIVSIGVSLDSNVVYYEHLKEDVLNGKTIRSATDQAFTSSFSTIVKADVASLIGAFLLWWLTVGPVRGFAFYLGLSTLLDLITSWAYMRPVVSMATRGETARAHPRWYGLPHEEFDANTALAAASAKARALSSTGAGG